MIKHLEKPLARKHPSGREEKSHHYRPGTAAFLDWVLQELLILRLPFQCLVGEIAQDFKIDLHFQSTSISTFQAASKVSLVDLLKGNCLCASHDNCVTAMPKGTQLVRHPGKEHVYQPFCREHVLLKNKICGFCFLICGSEHKMPPHGVKIIKYITDITANGKTVIHSFSNFNCV